MVSPTKVITIEIINISMVERFIISQSYIKIKC